MSKLSAFVRMAMGIVEKTALRMYGLQQGFNQGNQNRIK